MQNQSMMSSTSFSQSIISSAPHQAASDPVKINQLFEKIGMLFLALADPSFKERSNNQEIEERSIKNLSQKLSHKIIDANYLAVNHTQQIGCLMTWMNKRQGQCSAMGLANCIQIFKALSCKQEGKIVLRQYGCIEFFNEIIQQVQLPELVQDIETVLRDLLAETQELPAPTSQTNIFSQHLVKPMMQQQQLHESSGDQQKHQTFSQNSHILMSQIPERMDDSFQVDQSVRIGPQMQSRAGVTSFNKREFKIQSMGQSGYAPQLNSGAIDTSHIDLMHKQQILKEQCELPFVMLGDEDEKLIFDLSVQLKFGDFKSVINACQTLQNLSFFDFPIETFLQRTDIIKALLDLLEGAQGYVFTNLAQQTLLVLVQRLSNLYRFVCHNTNKPSHLQQNERDQTIPMDSYIEHSYPTTNLNRWNTQEAVSDFKKFGATTKTQNLTAATMHNSLSCRAVLGLILTKSIYLLKDTEKIGLYIQLINATLDALVSAFRVDENNEFSEFLHLCLFAFDSVCDFYKEQVFEEVLIQPVLFHLIKFVKLLNTIPPTEQKFKAPFTDSLYKHTENLQRTLRRTLFRNSFSTSRDEQSVQEVLTFFQRLESELSSVNLLQKNVTDSYNKALDVYQRFLNVTDFKLNSQSICDYDDKSGIVFVENLTQYYQALEILEELSFCVELKMDFPFERKLSPKSASFNLNGIDLLLDCMVYGVLAEQAQLDGKMEQIQNLSFTYLLIHLPEVRERLLRKMYQRIRVAHALQVNSKKEVNNNVLLSKFIYRKAVINQVVNGLLINPDIANEETKLQMSVGQLMIKILIIAYNEGGFIAQQTNLNNHLLTFQSLLPHYPDLIGLIDLIEENSQRNCRYQRLLRDLFHTDQSKREFATSVLRNNLSKDTSEHQVKDLLKESVDLRQPDQEVRLELDTINQNYDYSNFDVQNIQSILQNQTSDFIVKKSCLEQLTSLLFDVNNKRGKYLFKHQGVTDIFTFVMAEITSSYNTCQSYLRQQVTLLDSSQVAYINQCLRFVFYCYLFYNEEHVVKTFFGKIRLMAQPKEKQENDQLLEQYEVILNGLVFFSGSHILRKNALRVLFVSVFHPLLLCTKIQKQQANTGHIRKSLSILIPSFCKGTFVMIVPTVSQAIKQSPKEEIILNEEQKMFIEFKFNEKNTKQHDQQVLIDIQQAFLSAVDNKSEDFNQVMRSFELLGNYILSLQDMRDELINVHVANRIVELLKILPTREFEFNFLADYLMTINHLLQSYRHFKHQKNLELFLTNLSDALKYYILPFLMETGFANMEDSKSCQNTPKFYFMSRFLEALTTMTQVDLYLRKQLRCPSALANKIFTSNFITYLVDMYSYFKNSQEQRKKIMAFFYLLMSGYDTKNIQIQQLPDVFVNSMAAHKLTLLFQDSSITMQCMRSLIFMHQKRLYTLRPNSHSNDIEVSVNLTQTSVQYLQKYKSFGWLVRFTESRDSRVRCLCWDLLTEIFDYEFLKAHPSIVQTALNSYLKNSELYSVKIAVLKFLNKLSDSLIHNCDISLDEPTNEGPLLEANFVGSMQEHVSVRTLLQTINKQGLISQVHLILGQKECPLLFLTLTLKLIHKLVLMDYKRALPVLTQLDYWTFLVELTSIKQLTQLEQSESRPIIKTLSKSTLNVQDKAASYDMVYLALNSTLDFFFEAFKRDSQIAGLLVKTTKLLPMMFDLIQTTVVCFRQETLPLKNKSLLIIFFDKVVKMLHISLLHPQEYTISLLTKFLFDHEKTDEQADFKRRNWIYLVEMFKIINETSQSNYFYGHVDVKLALCRFISEFLLRLPLQVETHLDELVRHFPSQKLQDVMEETDLESYGSILLLEFGSVFKQLYIDRHQPQSYKGGNLGPEELQEQENTRVDICMCLSVLLARCLSAKTVAVDHNLMKKVVEVCQENASALLLDMLQKFTNKPVAPSKSTMNKSMISISQSVIDQRKFKYASFNDMDLCQREVLRMLEIIRHLFYQSGQLLVPFMFTQERCILQQSKLSTIGNKQKKKLESSLGERLVSLFSSIIEDLGSNPQFESIINECLLTAVTFASQNQRFKVAFITNISGQPGQTKRSCLLRTVTDKLQNESLQTNRKRMRLLFTLLRTLSMSTEVAKELLKTKVIEEILGQIQPVCKNEKDIKLMKHYLAQFTSFLAAFASTEEGQKNILVRVKRFRFKSLFEMILFVLDTVTPSQELSSEVVPLTNTVINSLLFLRNTSFTRSNKLHFLSNPGFLPCLLAFLSSPIQPARVKAYTAAVLWVILYNHQGVKAAMNKDAVTGELQLLRQEYQRTTDIGNYSYFINKSSNRQQECKGALSDKSREEEEQYVNKRMNQFTLAGLNGILNILQLQ